MIKVFGVCMHKGGVGKTTSVINLGYEFARLGLKTLIIDSDPQANASKTFNINTDKLENHIGCIFEGNKFNPQELVFETGYENLWIVPASIQIAPIMSQPPMGAEAAFKRFLVKVWDNFDYVLIDTPPGLNIMTTAALAAATDALLPIQCETFALQGITTMVDAIMKAKEILNEHLKIGGGFLTMVDLRPAYTKHVIQEVKDYFGENMYNTCIRRSVRITEAQNDNKPIQIYEEANNAAEDYRNLAKEVLERQ